jgi:hypothetical protein
VLEGVLALGITSDESATRDRRFGIPDANEFSAKVLDLVG